MTAAPDILTFGCRLNAFESEAMRELAADAGLGDAVIVNTCAVTGEAMRQARQAIRKARRERPGARIVVTGCGAQIDPAMFAAMPEVDHVLGNGEKMRRESFARIAAASAERVRVDDIFSVRETAGHPIEGFAGRARAVVEVQNGCDHRCTFCIIPFGRGRSRSVPAGEAVQQIARLVAGGAREVVLSGVDIASWGGDLPGTPRLGRLVRQILDLVPDLPRLRLSSIDPAAVDPEMFGIVAGEPRLMPHLHLSLQAGSDMILKRMKRRHSRADSVRLCAGLRAARPDIVFGADLIAGFPTESEAMFADTLALVEDCGLTWLHVFPYSARQGTPAARMPQLAMALRKERAARLRAAGDAAERRLLGRLVGRELEVLVERPDGSGHSREFAPVRVPGARPGELVTVTALPLDGGGLTGTAS